MAKKKIYKHHERTTIASALADAQPREIVAASGSREVVYTWANGDTSRLSQPVFHVKDYGAVGDGVTDDGPAIQAAIDAAAAAHASLYVPAATYCSTIQLTLPSEDLTLFGDGSDYTRIKYTGTTFQDFIVVGTAVSSTVNVKIKRIGLVGGEFKNGKARYVLYAHWFNTGCVLEDVLIRDGVGLLKIVQGYLSTMKGVRLQSTTPNRTLAGCTLAEWQEVYGDDCAPVMIKSANVTTLNTISLFRVGSEISDGITPFAVLILTGAVQTGPISIESSGTYTDVDVYNLISKYGTVLGAPDSGLDGGIGSHYYENCDFEFDALLTKEKTRCNIRPFWYNIRCGSYLVDNQGSGDVRLHDGEIYTAEVESLFHVLSSGGALSLGADVKFENVAFLPGERITDGSLGGGAANVFDATGTDYPMGTPDGGSRTGERKICTPKIVSNLTLATGTNGVGAYIDVLAGVLRRETGEFVSCSHPTDSNAMVYVRLHPPTASKYYRLFIGRAGQPYLVEYASAQTEPTGNWITEFATDGAGAIGALTANARLSVDGEYVSGSSVVRILGTAAPVAGYWQVGDTVINTNPSTSGAVFAWVCGVAGTPGTWNPLTLDAVFALLAGRAGGQTIAGGNAASENLTLQSTSHATKAQVRIGSATGIVLDELNTRLGVGKQPTEKIDVTASVDGGDVVCSLTNSFTGASSIDEGVVYRAVFGSSTGGQLRFKKEEDFTSGANRTASATIMVRKDGTDTDMVVASGASSTVTISNAELVIRSKTPSSASDTGTAGMIAWDTNYWYTCTATNTWKRVAIATW